ncbi:polysaccharide deacetylase family protein [bacterium]|nr:polysaccharide deacetylase family protein [bacterium]
MVSLMYHDVYRDTPYESGFQNESAFQYKIAVTQFEKQIGAIVNYCKRIKRDVNDMVKFTFDDGGVSFYTVVAPTLEKYGLKGIFFVSTRYIGTSGFMTREMIKDLAYRGHIIGSHSHTHPQNMAQLSYEEIVSEWNESASILSAIIGKKIEVASIPNGYAGKSVLTACNKNGLKDIYTSVPAARDILNAELHGRYVMYDTTNEEYVINLVSSKLFRFILGVQYNILSLVKFVLRDHYDKVKSLVVRR